MTEQQSGFVRVDGDDLILRNFEGGTYRYPDPGETYGARCGRQACASA